MCDGLLHGLGRTKNLNENVVVDVLERRAVAEVFAVNDGLRLG